MTYLSTLTSFASTENAEASEDIFSSLGIDWTMMALQFVAFVLLVAVLGKFVYPVFMKIIDKRETAMKESAAAAEVAREHAEQAEQEVQKLLAAARKDAQGIVSTAKDEAVAMVADAETKAAARAERIVAEAQEDIGKQVESAKKALHNETIELVAAATEKILGKNTSVKVTDASVANALKEAK